jgi:hypothetical protein
VPIKTITGIIVAAVLGVAAGALLVREPDFHAMVEADGTVVLCIIKRDILFADRCTGAGRLTIVHPIQEGEIVWRTANGKVELKNQTPQNPACALSHATWDQASERTVNSGKRINRLNPNDVMTSHFPVPFNVQDGELTGFAVDLDNDGKDESVFAFSNVRRLDEEFTRTNTPAQYVVTGAVSPYETIYPQMFYFETGTYQGGTDTIGHVEFKGVVPLAPESGDIAVLARIGTDDSLQELLRFRGQVQRIQAIWYRCQ